MAAPAAAGEAAAPGAEVPAGGIGAAVPAAPPHAVSTVAQTTTRLKAIRDLISLLHEINWIPASVAAARADPNGKKPFGLMAGIGLGFAYLIRPELHW
jgi:hypothetical protein